MRLSDAEWEVMDVVWREGSATARIAHDALRPATGWAYTTVKTMLARLAEKGALDVLRDGRSSVYRPCVSREEARRSAVRSLVDRAFDGAAAPMLRFLVKDRGLTSGERRELRRILRGEKRGGKVGKR